MGPGGQTDPDYPNCSACHDPEKRKQWGCDEPTTEPTAHITPCPFCSGGVPGCPHCLGENRVPVFRCMNKLATQREFDVLQACAMVEQGILPDAGGWTDQAYSFVRAYPVAMREITYWREERRKAAMAKAAKANKGR